MSRKRAGNDKSDKSSFLMKSLETMLKRLSTVDMSQGCLLLNKLFHSNIYITRS